MDDGMQFANENCSGWAAAPDTSKVIYKVGFRGDHGITYKYTGNDEAEYQEELGKLEAQNLRWASCPWMTPYEIISEIIKPEPVKEAQEETAVEIVESEAAPTIEITTVFYGGKGHEVDISESVRATIRAARGPFTEAQLVDALASANPDDEECSDPRELTRQVRNALRQFSDRMAATLPICEEIGAGRYVRKEVK